MTPEEERRLKIAAMGWQMRAERLKKNNDYLRRRALILLAVAVVESITVLLFAAWMITR